MSEEILENSDSEVLMQKEDEAIDLDVELSLTDSENADAEVEAPAERIVSVDTLFENNFHFGSKTKNRNKAMEQYVFMSKKDIDMIDLNKTAFLFEKALQALRKCVARGGRVLFVGTESHSMNPVKVAAEKCGQYYISTRWLGGLLTNWEKTFFPWILSMKKLEKQIEDGYIKSFKKKEQSMLLKKRDRFLKFYQGVKDMGGLPNMLVVTSHREKNAIKEAEVLGIPIVLLADTTANPSSIRYPVPGNDSSIKAVDLFCTYCATSCLEGLRDEMIRIEKKKEKMANKEPREGAREGREPREGGRERREYHPNRGDRGDRPRHGGGHGGPRERGEFTRRPFGPRPPMKPKPESNPAE